MKARELFGWCLLVIGWLIVISSALQLLVTIAMSFSYGHFLEMALIMGIVRLLIGWGLIKAGNSLREKDGNPGPPMSVKQFFGSFLIVTGLIVAVFAGGCTIIVSPMVSHSDFEAIVVPMGIVPCVLGIVAYVIGKAMKGKKDEYDESVEK